MIDHEIQQVRRVRHQVSAEFGHDLDKLADYYRSLEDKLRASNRYRFADSPPANSMAESTAEK